MTDRTRERKGGRHYLRAGLGWAGLFVVLFGLALVLRMPASIAFGMAASGLDLPAGTGWEQVYGSLWHGRIQGLQAPAGPLGQLEWTLRPGALLQGRAAADIIWYPPAGGELRGQLRLGMNRLELEDVRGELPAANLHEWDTGIPLLLDGRLHAHDVHLALDRERAVRHASGRIQWQTAAAGLPEPLPLGEQRATLQADDRQLELRLDSAPDAELSISGPLLLDLRPASPALRARLHLEPRADADSRIANLLRNNLRRDEGGRYQWTMGTMQ